MTNRDEARKRAERLRKLHHDAKVLVLPNIWDPLGARMLESLGFPAVATASAAVAYSLGQDDGQNISFETMLEVIQRIAASVQVPMTADVESGYAEEPEAVAANVRRVIEAGAAGINLEDSRREGGELRPLDVQCERLRAVRAMAEAEGVPLVINARVDVFLREGGRSRDDRIATAIERGRAYVDAGADCVYPIGPGDAETMQALQSGIQAPLNVYLSAGAASLQDLESLGIARASLGPGLIKASLTAMRSVARDLLSGAPYDRFTTEAISTAETVGYVARGPS